MMPSRKTERPPATPDLARLAVLIDPPASLWITDGLRCGLSVACACGDVDAQGVFLAALQTLADLRKQLTLERAAAGGGA